ncbi:hypothetical protein TNIN_204221 [Trichonephila inaurata madagascariensis]|uniref:6-phosphogluconate dehydrogenase NADP-binding domain-containing protein n=1 Tax=Trichonephila inaurata madagascariensis TaxID=2747483 RepID=A0A8X6JRE4_9ARAC|nr:hypothetical protein TNIN_204221 [Trichonephila inaurata madagascariensis]
MLEENIHHLSDEMICDAFEIFHSTMQDILEARGLIALKPESANEDSPSDDELTKNCTAALNPEEIVEIPSIREELPQTSRKTNRSRKFKKTNKKTKKTSKTKKLAQVEPDQKLSKMSDDYPGKNSPTEVNQPTDEDDLYVITSEHSSDDPLELSQVRNTFLGRNIKKPPGKIGFLGMVMSGQRIAEHLSNSGRDVFVWNTTPEKCQKLVKTKVQLCSTPSEVVRNCDIIFVCVSAGKPEKYPNFRRRFPRKAWVKNGIKCHFPDPTTSREITEYVINYGGDDGSA